MIDATPYKERQCKLITTITDNLNETKKIADELLDNYMKTLSRKELDNPYIFYDNEIADSLHRLPVIVDDLIFDVRKNYYTNMFHCDVK